MYTLVDSKGGYIDSLGTTVAGASFFICDNDSDIENLPKRVAVGSRALCIPTGNIYMFSPSKQWVKYKGVSILN